MHSMPAAHRTEFLCNMMPFNVQPQSLACMRLQQCDMRCSLSAYNPSAGQWVHGAMQLIVTNTLHSSNKHAAYTQART
jgi:hypothetical protein